jgi:hypothetical protein
MIAVMWPNTMAVNGSAVTPYNVKRPRALRLDDPKNERKLQSKNRMYQRPQNATALMTKY